MKWISPTLFVLCAIGAGGQSPAWPPPDSVVGDTIFADCAKTRAHHVVSPLSLSQNGLWRTYVDVDQGSPECLLRTSLWIARADGPYQLAYFIAPAREAGGNGMQILGWMPGPSVVLVKTERWQWGSDAGDIQQVLAIEASTGRVYEPRLDDVLERLRRNGSAKSSISSTRRASAIADRPEPALTKGEDAKTFLVLGRIRLTLPAPFGCAIGRSGF